MELDLIEISPKAEPPVCRIADYQKFLYQQKKEGQGTEGEPDESRREGDPLRPADRRPRLQLQAQARAELPQGGAKVKAYVFFRGRSIVFKEQGEILFLRFATDLEEFAKVEMMPKLDGKKMNMMLAPKVKK